MADDDECGRCTTLRAAHQASHVPLCTNRARPNLLTRVEHQRLGHAEPSREMLLGELPALRRTENALGAHVGSARPVRTKLSRACTARLTAVVAHARHEDPQQARMQRRHVKPNPRSARSVVGVSFPVALAMRYAIARFVRWAPHATPRRPTAVCSVRAHTPLRPGWKPRRCRSRSARRTAGVLRSGHVLTREPPSRSRASPSATRATGRSCRRPSSSR